MTTRRTTIWGGPGFTTGAAGTGAGAGAATTGAGAGTATTGAGAGAGAGVGAGAGAGVGAGAAGFAGAGAAGAGANTPGIAGIGGRARAMLAWESINADTTTTPDTILLFGFSLILITLSQWVTELHLVRQACYSCVASI